MSATAPTTPTPAEAPPRTHVTASTKAGAKRRRTPYEEQPSRGIISAADWRSPRIRRSVRAAHAALLGLLVLLGLGPMVWLAKAAVTPTEDTLSTPMAVFPHGADIGNLATAWNDIHLSLYFWNTLVIAAGSWLVQIGVAATGGFALSVLRPKYAKLVNALVLATLFIPAVVLLVPLYLTILDTPFVHRNLINTYWAVWLPAGANAFNVVLVKRFFDSLPREVFEAASMDGAGPFRLFWSVVLPMSRPILGVVSVFAVVAAWKDFLWPLLVLTDPEKQPLSVRLPTLAASTELDIFLAALFISTAFPVALFLVFQRVFLRSSGLGGAVKG